MGSVNYPPEKVYRPSNLKNLNYDHIILWMLSNNEVCKWSDFRCEPIEIPTGSLSRHMETLKRKGFVENIKRGYYKITSEGKKRFHELSMEKKKIRRLNYPPKLILNSGRNYPHWILWMVYNNNYCKRTDFLKKPLSINQSSLSKSLSLLVEKGFIEKEDKKYKITNTGKSAYSRMLQNYDLDRQTILEEENKRIEGLTDKVIKFFEKYKIKDKEIQFRFLNYILKLDYEKVKSLLNKEGAFYKIILFLALNHPDHYPHFISFQDFSRIYEIKEITLEYYIGEISEGKIYPLRFFKLEQLSGEKYYFLSNGPLEKMLRVITENEITKISYLNKLFSKSEARGAPSMQSILKKIINKSCNFLIHKDLGESLRNFLPGYIKYLAYKFETKKEFKNSYDKLEGLIWQSITDLINSQIYRDLEEQCREKSKKIDREIELDPENLNLYYLKLKQLIYFNQYNDAVQLLDNMLKDFSENEKDIKLLKAMVLRRMQNIQEGLKIIDELIQRYHEDHSLLSYKAYWLQFLDKKQDALAIIQMLSEKEPDQGVYQDTYGEILMYFQNYEEAAKKFVKSLLLGADEWYIFQTYIKLGICYKAIGKLELATKNLKEGIEMTEKNVKDSETKQKWLTIANLFLLDLS
jgi:tetratricopeptide (TPR) repeat protein/Mn-dependent DtxR family transcriptional regulator